jgi:hypothetical protein
MKNYLVNIFYSKDRRTEAIWREICRVSTNSYRKNLLGDWEYIRHELDGALHHDKIFFKNFELVRSLWASGNNVLVCDTDTVCVKPIEIFGKFHDFSMFWHSSPPTNERFPVRFNSGVVYIPKETKPSVWEVGEERWKEYFKKEPQNWAANQDVYNYMLYSQRNKNINEFLHNELNYLESTPELNDIQKEEAKIVHLFATRATPQEVLDRMLKY